MIATYKNKGVTWIDLVSPTDDEIKNISEQYKINALVTEELVTPSLRPKVDLYHNFIYLILHFPARDSATPQVDEIDFIIGKNFLITNRHNSIESLEKVAKIFEMHGILEREGGEEHAGFLFHQVARALYGSLLEKIEVLQNTLSSIEQNIFAGRERDMVIEISKVSRSLLDFRHALLLHKEVLESFEAAGKHFFGEKFSYHLTSITGEYYKTENAIKGTLESLAELRETNNSLLTTKQNEVMKVLTVVSFISLPLAVIASLFQVDAVSRPIIGQPNDFWIIIGIMLIAVLFNYLFFKIYKKWL